VPPEIKFCGMTRPEDVEAALDAGASYIGVIFAGGRRTVSVDQARALMSRVPGGVGRVGVFGPDASAEAIAGVARQVGLDVIQLHGDPDPASVTAARGAFGGAVWAGIRVRQPALDGAAVDLFRVADAVVLDAYSPDALGGTGVELNWAELAPAVASARASAKVVLAGGLKPHTVAAAVRIVRPDIVDVSSGVEASPGVKDHAKLRAFGAAVRSSVEAAP
jgi:phosphoribosylanthranilate isomerase